MNQETLLPDAEEAQAAEERKRAEAEAEARRIAFQLGLDRVAWSIARAHATRPAETAVIFRGYAWVTAVAERIAARCPAVEYSRRAGILLWPNGGKTWLFWHQAAAFRMRGKRWSAIFTDPGERFTPMDLSLGRSSTEPWAWYGRRDRCSLSS